MIAALLLIFFALLMYLVIEGYFTAGINGSIFVLYI